MKSLIALTVASIPALIGIALAALIVTSKPTTTAKPGGGYWCPRQDGACGSYDFDSPADRVRWWVDGRDV